MKLTNPSDESFFYFPNLVETLISVVCLTLASNVYSISSMK